MKGLIKKDFLLIRKFSKLLIFYFLITGTFCMIPFFLNDDVPFYGTLISAFFIHLTAIIFSMFIITAFEFDEASGWMRQAMTIVSRKRYLLAKYLFHLLNGTIGAVISTATLLIGAVVSGEISSPYVLRCILLSGLGGMEIVLYMGAVLVPLLVKFGTAKGKFLWVPVFLPVLALLVCTSFMNMRTIAVIILPFAVPLLLLVIGVIFAVMLALGMLWVKKKEL